MDYETDLLFCAYWSRSRGVQIFLTCEKNCEILETGLHFLITISYCLLPCYAAGAAGAAVERLRKFYLASVASQGNGDVTQLCTLLCIANYELLL